MIYTYLLKMPSAVHEFVTETVDGDHAIFINENISDDMQKKAFDHALEHIRHNDFDSFQTADEIEKERM